MLYFRYRYALRAACQPFKSHLKRKGAQGRSRSHRLSHIRAMIQPGPSAEIARVLRIDPRDDVMVALEDLDAGTRVGDNGGSVTIRDRVPAKHKISMRSLPRGSLVRMYGTTVGITTRDVEAGELISTGNLQHATAEISTSVQRKAWTAPDVSRWAERPLPLLYR